MIILNIYVCTVIFAIISFAFMSIEVKFYAKAHNLVSTANRSFAEQLWVWFKLLVRCAIPLFNIFVGLCFLTGAFNENFLERTTQACIDKGTIKYKDSEEKE